MLDWNDLRYFLAVHRSGNLARAGAELGINATTVSRRLTALEEQVHARLFDRTPDGYVLTSPGTSLVEYAERMEIEALALERIVVGADTRAEGSVRMTVTEMLATRFIMPFLSRFRAQNPGVTLEIECTNRTVSLARREADIALRLARPREDNVATKKLATIPIALYASQSYVAQNGLPDSPDESLAGHSVLMFAKSRTFELENTWLEARTQGAHVALRSDSVSSIYAATVGSLGIALLPRAVADRDTRLTRLETKSAPEPRVIWQAVHVDLQKNARIRAVLDFLGEILVPPEGDPYLPSPRR
jgi:DNA-binding transcriptional LysR family regulator